MKSKIRQIIDNQVVQTCKHKNLGYEKLGETEYGVSYRLKDFESKISYFLHSTDNITSSRAYETISLILN